MHGKSMKCEMQEKKYRRTYKVCICMQVDVQNMMKSSK